MTGDASGTRQLLVYEFGADARFEGQLVGALERGEPEGGMRVLDALFVMDEPDAGGFAAVDLHPGGAGDTLARLLTFRLDAEARRRATERVLDGRASVPPETVRSLAAALERGGAILALLVDPEEDPALRDAVERTGGRRLAREPADATGLGELAARLEAVVAGR